VGIILITLGALSLVYGGFSYTEDSHKADLGPIELRVNERERVNVPVWVGVGAIVIGAGLLLAGKRA
jgi:hypothetical protein